MVASLFTIDRTWRGPRQSLKIKTGIHEEQVRHYFAGLPAQAKIEADII